MDKRERQQRRKYEDATFNRMLLWLAGAVVVELLMVLLKRAYVDMWLGVGTAGGLLNFFELFRFAGLALVIAGSVWLIINVRNHKPTFIPAAVTALLAGLWVVSVLAYYLFDTGLRILMVLPAVAAVLILIYFLYQRTFFVNAVLTCGGLAALWLQRQYYMNHPTSVLLCFIGGFVLLVLAATLAWRLSAAGGKLRGVQLVPENTMYSVIYLSCAITGVSMLISLFLGATAAFYLMFVLLAWLFIQAVFFTVKLM